MKRNYLLSKHPQIFQPVMHALYINPVKYRSSWIDIKW